MVYIGITIITVAIILLFIFLKKKQDELKRKFHAKYANRTIRHMDKQVFFAAQASKGYSQTQGLGYLILTDKDLCFEMQLLDKHLSIPITSITGVGDTRRMGGKSTGKNWLKVDFIDGNGREDAVALSVKDPAAWKDEIKAAIMKST